MESELSQIAPILEEARRAVGGIKKDNLNEIRSLKMPPEAIRDVLEVKSRPTMGLGSGRIFMHFMHTRIH